MKLLNLTGSYYALFVIGIILIGGVLSYKILVNRINRQFNNKLTLEKEQLIYELESYQSLRETYYLNIGDKIDLIPIAPEIKLEPVLSDTIMYDDYAKKDLLYRQYKFTTTVENQNYQVNIYKSLLSTEELIKVVGEIMLTLLVSLLMALVLVNRYLSKGIWNPFYKILEGLKQFDISKPFTRPATGSRVDEFNELDKTIGDILERSAQDFKSLKEFTESSSHEIQTPLAIIKSKCELLLQSTSISKEDLIEIKGIYDSALRLSKLNQSLTLLTKIESNQFIADRNLKIASYIDELLSSFTELIEIRKLKVRKTFNHDPELIINENLAYILFSNLINNALKHNKEYGFVEIKVSESEIVFTNSGPPLQGDPTRLFERFKKDSSSQSPGLGLALVKNICDLYKLKISYSYSDLRHKISLEI